MKLSVKLQHLSSVNEYSGLISPPRSSANPSPLCVFQIQAELHLSQCKAHLLSWFLTKTESWRSSSQHRVLMSLSLLDLHCCSEACGFTAATVAAVPARYHHNDMLCKCANGSTFIELCFHIVSSIVRCITVFHGIVLQLIKTSNVGLEITAVMT